MKYGPCTFVFAVVVIFFFFSEVSISTSGSRELDITLREVLEEIVSCMCGVHDATHSCVLNWPQHNQHLQTETVPVPNLQTAVLTVQVLAFGEYHSENGVSLPVLHGRV
jgi:hypothetical protein